MLTPIVCFTCGMPIGDLAPMFHHMRARMIEKALAAEGAEGAPAAPAPNSVPDCTAIFEELGVPAEQECCRARLVTTKLYSDSY